MFIIALAALPPPASATEGTGPNMKDALSRMRAAGLKVSQKDSDLCLNENFCSATVGQTTIQSIGWSVKALVSSQEPFANYQKVCAAILSGLTSVSLTNSENYISQAFISASSNGRAEVDIAGVELEVRTGFDSRLTCNFTSYRHRRSG